MTGIVLTMGSYGLQLDMLRTRAAFIRSVRTYASFKEQRPGPPPLPKKDQEEFERLQKEANEQATGMHPAVRDSYPEFDGEVNPVTGEVGGPKQDPLRHGDYAFNGRVTDF